MTVTSTVYLEVNSTPLATFAWTHVDLAGILADAVKGSDGDLPLTAGRRPYPHRRDALEASIPMEITGATDEDGTPNADPWAGVITNFLELKSGLGIGSDAGDGTVTATLHLPSTTYSADVHVLGFSAVSWRGGATIDAMLDLSIPSGEFTEDP